MIRFFRRLRHLDERVEEARRERELSEERLAEIRQDVVRPLRRYAEQNNFASMLAASIARGHENGASR